MLGAFHSEHKRCRDRNGGSKRKSCHAEGTSSHQQPRPPTFIVLRLELQCRDTMEIRTKHHRASFEAGFEAGHGLKPCGNEVCLQLCFMV